MMHRLAPYLGLARSMVIYYGQPWKRAKLRRFYRHLLKRNDLVFDIGAHVGSRAMIFRQLGCHVVALEPQPLFRRFLKRAMPSDIILIGSAVAASPGTLRLNISSRHPTVSTLSRDWIDNVAATDGFAGVDWDQSIDVPVTTLDLLIADHGLPDFVKIDVEGMEAEILAGLSQPVALVAVEYLPAALGIAEASIDRLDQLGPYEFNHVEGEAASFLLPDWLDGQSMKAHLRMLAANGRSGDLYARLRKTIQSPGSAPTISRMP